MSISSFYGKVSPLFVSKKCRVILKFQSMKWLDDPNGVRMKRKKKQVYSFFQKFDLLQKKFSCDDVKMVSPLQNFFIWLLPVLFKNVSDSHFLNLCFGVMILPEVEIELKPPSQQMLHVTMRLRNVFTMASRQAHNIL